MTQVRLALTLIMIFLAPAVSAYAQDTRTVDVRFPRGSSGTELSNSITGYQAINYQIGVSAGQTMSVQLDTNNSSNYFNITAPGASEALYNGSVSGNSTSFVIPSSGTYTVSVYLMRNAARRNETASFSINFYVESGSSRPQRPITLPAAPAAPNFADGLEGGPDFWQVQGLSGDTLNVRSGPSTSNSVIGTVRDGDVLRNFGCTMSGSTRWCQIQTPNGQRGWVAGRYLHESFGTATTLPSYPAQPIVVQPQAAQMTISMADMPRYCVGEVSAEAGIRPQDITANTAYQSGNRYVSQGWYDVGDDTEFFNCWFSLNGDFLYVE